jgi:hypothetical protein
MQPWSASADSERRWLEERSAALEAEQREIQVRLRTLDPEGED